MTLEQVTRRKGWVFALISAGIACLYMAYQYATPAPRSEPPPEWAPFLFAGIAVVCLIVSGLIALKLKEDGTPAAVTDLSGPQGKTVKVLLVIGLIALAGTYFVGYITPAEEPLGLALSVGLLVIVGACFVSAGRIAR
ncbi:MAG: hypothetical protein ABSF41_16655 [Pseudolabrys sp.]|jgi:4-hydroxybenzoate polyprenyltransferase